MWGRETLTIDESRISSTVPEHHRQRDQPFVLRINSGSGSLTAASTILLTATAKGAARAAVMVDIHADSQKAYCFSSLSPRGTSVLASIT